MLQYIVLLSTRTTFHWTSIRLRVALILLFKCYLGGTLIKSCCNKIPDEIDNNYNCNETELNNSHTQICIFKYNCLKDKQIAPSSGKVSKYYFVPKDWGRLDLLEVYGREERKSETKVEHRPCVGEEEEEEEGGLQDTIRTASWISTLADTSLMVYTSVVQNSVQYNTVQYSTVQY